MTRRGSASRPLAWRALPPLLIAMLCGAAIGACTGGPDATPVPQVAGDPSAAGASAVPFSPQVIGARGGSVASADGSAYLQIPPGALKSDVTIRVTAGSPTGLPPGVLRNNEVTQLGRFEPDGTRFEQPVRVTLRLPGVPAGTDGLNAPVRLLASRSADGIALLTNQDETVDLASGEVRLRHWH